ncbi:sigma-70 family RNA polymerase sigma factor [Streptomyces sp. NPDC019937]|uniref:BACON domain-containing protein n=1 Tax=Streptomyces sp. NPDC019937 TaxID=3154787 RepID=UPI0034101E62
MSSRSEHSTHAAGAHRAKRRAPRVATTRPQRPPARYEPYLDGLFTYCLSVLCEHDAAAVTLGDVLAVAERRLGRGRGRAEAEEEPSRPWLYAVARWACLRKLAELREQRDPRDGRDGPGTAPPEPVADARRRELAALAWPEAAGTTAAQREALELHVRHQLTPAEVAAALGKEPDETRALLSSAACEVERTRAALAVVELGHCPVVARRAGDTQVLLSAALRRELVRHVDDCRECRRMAERATADGPWPGTAAAPAALPVLEAPRPDVHAAMLCALSARPVRAAAGPRFDRRGFPLDPQDRAARRSRLRSRALTTTVVATVIAAPVLALWAAYRGAPLAGDEHDTDSVAAANADGADGADGAGKAPAGEQDRSAGRAYEQAGSAQDRSGAARLRTRAGAPGAAEVTVEVIGADGDRDRLGSGAGRSRRPSGGGRHGGESAPPRPAPGPGRLTVEAQPSGDVTVITLAASGGAPVYWSASASGGAPWLQLSRTAGELRPGESVTITVSVDEEREPPGRWRARVMVAPSGAMVVIEGQGPAPTPTPTPPGTPSPPSTPPPSDPPTPKD